MPSELENIEEVVTRDESPKREWPKHRVYTRAGQTDQWELQPHLYADWVEFVAAPAIDSAQLSWRFGRGQQPDAFATDNESARKVHEPKDISGHFIQIIIDSDDEADTNDIPDFFGQVIDEYKVINGTTTIEGGVKVTRGQQSFIAYGRARELDIQPILSSVAKGVKRSELSAEDYTNRAVPINRGKGGSRDFGIGKFGNRSAEVGDEDVYTFAEKLDEAKPWNALNFLEYLFAYHAPTMINEERITLKLDIEDQSQLLEDYVIGSFDYHGKTLKEILDSILNSRRGLGWRFFIDPETADPTVRVFTYSVDDIELPSGGMLNANLHKKSIDWHYDPRLISMTVQKSEITRYHQIRAEGNRIGYVFTISQMDETLERDWTSEQEEAYNKGASEEEDYGDLKDHEKQQRNDLFRLNHSLSRVFSWFRLKANWDGKVKDGLGGTEIDEEDPSEEEQGFNAMPRLAEDNDDILTDKVANLWLPGARFERHLPLLTDKDYEGDLTPDDEESEVEESEFELPEDSLPQQIPTLVLFKVDDDFWVPIEQLAATTLSGQAGHHYAWSAQVRMQERVPGIILTISGGTKDRGRQHKIAAADFEAADEADEVMNDAEANWRTDILATVYLIGDEHVSAVYPDTGDLEDTVDGNVHQVTNVKRIRVADAHADYVVPTTVFGVRDGKLLRTGGGLIRDDRKRLRDVAHIAHVWYGKPRQTVTIAFERVKRIVDPGDMITKVGKDETEEVVNTVVTKVRYDLQSGTTVIQTQHAELDFTAVATKA